MDFQPVILWTDALIFLLIGMVALFVRYVLSQPHMLEPWKRVIRSGVAMASATLLLAFLIVGLLDSLHYRPKLPDQNGKTVYAVEVWSVLDKLLRPLKEKKEKTYSAPLATHAFAKEAMERPDGTQAREYPRLKHGGVHLADPASQWAGDVAGMAFRGGFKGVLAWLALAATVTLLIARQRSQPYRACWRDLWLGRLDLPWRTVLVTLALLMLAGFALAELARHYHVLGTDKVGQDVLYLALKSVRTALVIGTLTTLIMLPVAVLLGILAGYLKGWVDDVIQYVYTTLNSIPDVLLIAAAVLMIQVVIDTHPAWFDTAAHRADARLLALCLILGVTSWTGLCRLLRGETLKLRELEYVQAAQAFGVGTGRILLRHLLPNVMHIVLITVVMQFSGLVLSEAVLSYIGVGVDPATQSFGTLINAARMEMAREPMVWWTLAAAFLFMFALVLAANLFADAVRDAFDPRLSMRPTFLRMRVGAKP